MSLRHKLIIVAMIAAVIAGAWVLVQLFHVFVSLTNMM